MEELLLSWLLSYYKLNIIDKKHINVSVTVSECRITLLCILFITDSINKFVGKCFTGNIQYFFGGIMFQNVMCHGVHQMGLSKSNTSIYKERIVYFTRWFCNSYRSCMCKTVVVTNDKCIKCIIRIKIKRKVVWIAVIWLRWCCFYLFLLNLFLMFNIFIRYKSNRVFIIHNLTDSYFKKFAILLFYKGDTHTSLRY